MNNIDHIRWLLKVRDALAEQDETKRDSMLRAADRFLRGNNQSLELRGTGLGESRRRESPNQFVQRQRVVGLRARELTGPKKQLLLAKGDPLTAVRAPVLPFTVKA
jgi:hypothetical protein